MTSDKTDIEDSVKAPANVFFSAMQHRNFRLFFFGQGFSLIGSWMQITALGWLVWETWENESRLGTIWFFSQIPNLFLAPIAGVFADRHSRVKILMTTQSLAMLQAIILAALTLSGITHFSHLILLALMLGIVNSFDMPTRQAFVVDMVNKEDLPNAIAMNSFAFNIARILAPPTAGFLLLKIDPGVIFMLNAFTFLSVLGALMAMKLPAFETKENAGNVLHNLEEGFAYVRKHIVLRDVLLFIGVIGFMALPYQVLMPAIADDVLGGGPRAFGMLMAMIGLGSLAGAFLVMRGMMSDRLEKQIGLAGTAFGLCLIVFSTSKSLPLSMAILFPTGAAMMIQTLSTNTLVQKMVSDNVRGRVMSFYTMMLLGVYPIGSQFMGWMAKNETIGSLLAVRLGGVCCMIAGLIILYRLPKLRESMNQLSNS